MGCKGYVLKAWIVFVEIINRVFEQALCSKFGRIPEDGMCRNEIPVVTFK